MTDTISTFIAASGFQVYITMTTSVVWFVYSEIKRNVYFPHRKCHLLKYYNTCECVRKRWQRLCSVYLRPVFAVRGASCDVIEDRDCCCENTWEIVVLLNWWCPGLCDFTRYTRLHVWGIQVLSTCVMIRAGNTELFTRMSRVYRT